MASRAFELRNHHHKTFAFSRCGKCGFETEVPRPRMRLGAAENEGWVIVRKLEAIGCYIAKDPKDDRCAQCATPQQRLQQKFRVIDHGAPRQSPPAELLFRKPPPTPKPSRAEILALVLACKAQLAEIETLLTK